MYEAYYYVDEFVNQNPELFEQPIIKSFFQDQDHFLLLKKAIEHNDENANQELNQQFIKFYMTYRLVSYISVLSRRYTNDYDQKLKKHQDRHVLILDKPVSKGDDAAIIDLFHAEYDDYDLHGTITDIFSDERLINAINELSNKKKRILELTFMGQLSIKEIAEYFNDSSQNISKHKRDAVNKIKSKLS
ncbi:sigma factor-like helix-turn-helix DNA-binding protein [Alkalibacillus almallahensis]|uniref:sigma factor-like helix-turn-helix DNA-binding protein n=1 Tax=Alkalibacillus almallahensis TaxID=1379154 RepID=UPI0014209661|nr:sigma factor-like helix-turn-helix DNA-binding protein [Alkalibacillus almallahensis]NIK12746.1 RNA polymerase sigma factor (sigma-70 family) [Alkalibacillus almallahensis]